MHSYHRFAPHHVLRSLKDKFKSFADSLGGFFGQIGHPRHHQNEQPPTPAGVTHGEIHFKGNPFLHAEPDSALGEPIKLLDVPPEPKPVTKAEARRRRKAF